MAHQNRLVSVFLVLFMLQICIEAGQENLVRSKAKLGMLDHLLSRHRRWDFPCHCHGYHVECMADEYCQNKHHSEAWSCQETCCGFACKHTDEHATDSKTYTHPGRKDQMHNMGRGYGRG